MECRASRRYPRRCPATVCRESTATVLSASFPPSSPVSSSSPAVGRYLWPVSAALHTSFLTNHGSTSLVPPRHALLRGGTSTLEIGDPDIPGAIGAREGHEPTVQRNVERLRGR